MRKNATVPEAAAAPPPLTRRLRLGLERGLRACWVLFRISVPTYIVMDLLARLGVIAAIGKACAPLMGLFRLPGEAAIAVLLGYLVNIYAATAAAGSLGLSSGQILTLGLILGFAHTLVVESLVLRAARARPLPLLAYRLAMSIVAGLVASRLLVGAGP